MSRSLYALSPAAPGISPAGRQFRLPGASGNPGGPFIAKQVVTIGEIPDIPGLKFPLKYLEPVKIICIYQRPGSDKRVTSVVLLHHFRDGKTYLKIGIYAFCQLWHFA
jgi:hypothetical protein